MDKNIQRTINNVCINYLEGYNALVSEVINSERLRSCSARVLTVRTGNGTYKLLQSYSTVVAFIAPDGMLVDVLRYVYGFTATSCQHIAKFRNDYAHTDEIRYRPL